MNYTEYALIVAGGKGTRIKSKIPKQFLELNGLPFSCIPFTPFIAIPKKSRLSLFYRKMILTPGNRFVIKYNFHKPLILQHGGDSRFQSVKNGLDKIDGDGLVAIHDGVRPLVNEDIIGASFRLAAVHQSAVAAVRLKESIRMTDQDQHQSSGSFPFQADSDTTDLSGAADQGSLSSKKKIQA